MIAADESNGKPFRSESRWRIAAVVVFLFLTAGILRVYRISAWSFWADEISTLRDAHNLANVKTYPVGYFLIGQTVNVLGADEFGARILPAMFGAAGVAALYLIGRRLFTERAAILAAILLGLCSFDVYYSQYARYYTMLLLFVLIGAWAVFEGLEKDSKKRVAIGTLMLSLACWTHWTAGLIIPALAAYVIVSALRGTPPPGFNKTNAAIILAPFVIGGIVFSRDAYDLVRNWTGGGFSFKAAGLMILKLADRMEPAAVLCGLPAIWLTWKTGDRRGWWLISFAYIPCLLIVVFVGFAVGGTRFAFVALPAFMLLAGVGLDLLLRLAHGAGKTMAVAIVVIVVFSLGAKCYAYFTIERGERPRWREASEFVLQRLQKARVFATAPAIFNYYAERGGWSQRALPLSDAFVRPLERGDVFIVEHVANVMPSTSQFDHIRDGTRECAEFPLHVSFLDYSISIHVAGEEINAEP